MAAKPRAPANAVPNKLIKKPPPGYTCTMCGRMYADYTYFPQSRSVLYKSNEGHITVCKDCVNELYRQYCDMLGNSKDAVKRICEKFDIYYSEAIYDASIEEDKTKSPILTYISKSIASKGGSRTYDDTISDEIASSKTILTISDNDPIPPETVAFWGEGYTASFYRAMQREYNRLCGGDDSVYQPAEIIMIKDICRLQATIEKESAEGRPIDKNVNALHTLLGAMNLKPAQQKDSAEENGAEMTPFGVWIRKIENTRPVSEPLPEWRDVDGIVKYITVWFFGHLCKMLKINNRYAALYEEEVAKYSVSRPEYDEDEEDDMYDNIFERANAAEEAKERMDDEDEDGDEDG